VAIMDRLSRLIRANVNDIIDRAEDPEKMLDQILRDMQSNITAARAQVASMIAQEKELEGDLEETSRLALEWGNKAQRAVTAGKDDLAREALRRKRDNEANAKIYGDQVHVQGEMVEKLKSQLRQLEAKYQSTLSQRDTMIARQRRAHAQQQVASTLSSISPMDPTSELDRMERKIRGGEARAAALTEMADESYEAQFQELDYDDEVEAELAALKGGSDPALTASSTTSADDGGPLSTDTSAPQPTSTSTPGSPS